VDLNFDGVWDNVDTAIAASIYLAIDITIRVLAILFIPENRRPTAAMGWLLAIFFFPVLGALLFVVLGTTKLPKHRRQKQEEVNVYIKMTTEGVDLVSDEKTWPPGFASAVRLNRELGALPLVGGNHSELYPDYEESLAAMAEAIDQAREFVNVEFYILSYDSATEGFFTAMENAVKRGVVVRVLLDHIAALRAVGNKQTIAKLSEIGTEWHYMLPFQPLKGKIQRPDLRNHRKLLVIDGEVAFIGSQNVIDTSYNKKSNIKRGLMWKDLMARVDGPIVAGVNAVFVSDWFMETGERLLRDVHDVPPAIDEKTLDAQVVPSGPGFEGENNLRLFLSLLYSAQRSIIITSPYFVPDDSLIYAITSATARGVHVELFVSEIGDQALVFHAQRSYYEELLRAGVVIYMYQPPYILHAKHLTIDDEIAVVGSSNMDIRSFVLNMELSVMFRGRSFVRQMREVEEAYRNNSTQLILHEWLRRPFRSKVLDNLARLTSALQ